MSKTKHIAFIETLRAFAACSVLGFHFICFNNGIGDIYLNETVKGIATYGAQGVELFYIISGFVITFALTRSGYKIIHYGKYVLKRVIRIIPVFFMTIFAIYSFEFFMAKIFWGYEIQLDYSNILANLTFTVDLWEGATWINPIFSTLGVEFQFYLLIGLLLPLIQYKAWSKYVILSLLIVAGLNTMGHQTVLVNMPYFALGIVMHDVYTKNLIKLSYIFLGILMIVLLRYYLLEDLIVSALTLLLFLVIKPSFRISNEIGKFSYSLYLTHGLFGGWLLFFLSRDEYINLTPYLTVPMAFVFSLIGAKVFYLLFEKPSISWGKKIKYK
jgi:peptidoglycan/LPS O-acetylase OafA/YrhL